MEVWTFNWQYSINEWWDSAQRFDTPKQAAQAAADWMVVNAINGHAVIVSIYKLPKDAK